MDVFEIINKAKRDGRVTEIQKKEYDYLLNEINKNVSLHNELVTTSMALSVSAVTLAYAYDKAPDVVLLLPFCILIPMAMRVAYYRRFTAKISAYMIVFLEGCGEKSRKQVKSRRC